MGLIAAALGAASGVLADQWKEYFYCDALPANVLMVKGQKRVSGRSTNTKGSENVISDGSIVNVADGQCMMIVENGKIVDLCAVPGEYKYETGTEPSLLDGGNLGSNIKAVFAEFGKRFTFGGEVPKDQRIYYFNTKVILGNKYGTPASVPFRVYDPRLGFDQLINIRCFGEYSYRITNPMSFYINVCGNQAEQFTRDQIDSTLKSELLTKLQPAFARISARGIQYYELPGCTEELRQALTEELTQEWVEERGISIAKVNVSSVKADEEDEATLKELQKAAALSNAALGAGYVTSAYGTAMKDAAKNEGGAAMAFMNMNTAQTMGGNMATNLYNVAAQNGQTVAAPVQQQQPAADTWTCPKCGKPATGNFCTECGTQKPAAPEGWTCPKCGKPAAGNFCCECGTQKPAAAASYKCSKCGWIPSDPSNPPKFCPSCGDPFGAEDIQ